MLPRTRNIATTAALVAVALFSAFSGYLYAKEESGRESLERFYVRSASEARFLALTLSHLRSGDKETALRSLDAMLVGNLISLANYERDIPLKRRDKTIYDDIAKVRIYYRQFPQPDSLQYAEEALSLGGGEGVAP
ncbi:hypothetical protein H0E84_15135 [Luteimonas sp. SJ-92]|uniref:Uncharacterized protein n=1 Tax=Luteimonas salinisoli TaxID=2752307 RepID=A0A853JG35_9GAMM|nr:hypothetical protein [Luteimonas salinisoli]NZA27714.1 hypothetical protein [Luteimonas salinisoli]